MKMNESNFTNQNDNSMEMMINGFVTKPPRKKKASSAHDSVKEICLSLRRYVVCGLSLKKS